MTHRTTPLCWHGRVDVPRRAGARSTGPVGTGGTGGLCGLGVARAALLALALGLCGHAMAADTSAAAQLQHWSAEAGRAGDAPRGQAFFNSQHGGEWSCASCHGTPPTKEGKHANTGKVIAPLAPAFNPKAFTEVAKVDKWFRRNCKDVLSRECTAAEKADVLAYLIQLK